LKNSSSRSVNGTSEVGRPQSRHVRLQGYTGGNQAQWINDLCDYKFEPVTGIA